MVDSRRSSADSGSRQAVRGRELVEAAVAETRDPSRLRPHPHVARAIPQDRPHDVARKPLRRGVGRELPVVKPCEPAILRADPHAALAVLEELHDEVREAVGGPELARLLAGDYKHGPRKSNSTAGMPRFKEAEAERNARESG